MVAKQLIDFLSIDSRHNHRWSESNDLLIDIPMMTRRKAKTERE
jgi:hypothetical protein